MTPHTGPPTATRLDLPALDAIAMTYAQGLRLIPDDVGSRRTAREQLVAAALPFAGRLAKKYRGRGEPMEDLEQVARLGLLKAVDRYDPERGAFTGFAAVTIIGELRRHFRDRTWGVHVPRRMQELSLEVNRATADLTAELRRAPTVPELARRLRIGEEDVLTALETAAAYSTLSLNAPARADSEADAEMGDLIGVTDLDLDAVDDRVTVSALLCRLPERERRILAMRFYGNQTQSQIATELGISQMHVSRLLSRALTWLREAMLSDAPQYWQAGPAPSDRHELSAQTLFSGDLAVVEVAGEVDRDTVGALRDALAAAVRLPVREIEVRLTGVPLVDAVGISTLLAGQEAAQANGMRLRITAAKPYVLRALRVAGLNELIS
jgi:RNA polymerase sigma-B factor